MGPVWFRSMVYDCRVGFFAGSSGFFKYHYSHIFCAGRIDWTHPTIDLEFLLQDWFLCWHGLPSCCRRNERAHRCWPQRLCAEKRRFWCQSLHNSRWTDSGGERSRSPEFGIDPKKADNRPIPRSDNQWGASGMSPNQFHFISDPFYRLNAVQNKVCLKIHCGSITQIMTIYLILLRIYQWIYQDDHFRFGTMIQKPNNKENW